MKKCFQKLGISFTEEEIGDFFNACDFNDDMGIKFSEFIVLLCLVYLLKDDQAALHTVSETNYSFSFFFSFLLCVNVAISSLVLVCASLTCSRN